MEMEASMMSGEPDTSKPVIHQYLPISANLSSFYLSILGTSKNPADFPFQTPKIVPFQAPDALSIKRKALKTFLFIGMINPFYRKD